MGGWGKLRAQTRAEAKGENSDEQEWVVDPTNSTAPDFPCPLAGGLMGAGGIPLGTNPQLNWQQ